MLNGKKFAAIVLAAGSGHRMNSRTPKQFMELHGFPVLYYSLKAFEDSPVDAIILVTRAEDVDFCREELVKRYGFQKVEAVVAGGAERYLSVYEGIKAAGAADYVLIHDGARPLLSLECILKSMEYVQKESACALAVPVKDTIKAADGGGYVRETLDRKTLWAMQTPQSFSRRMILAAYERMKAAENTEGLPEITDDAMMVEYFLGEKVKLIEGDYHNRKITTPEDLEIAKMFLRNFHGNS